MYGLTLITAPTEEPLSLSEAGAWLRLEGDALAAETVTLTGMIAAARRLCEQRIGRQLCTATWRLALDNFPWPGGWAALDRPTLFPDPHTIRVPKAPLQSVTSVTYYDLAGTLQTLASTVYDVDAARDPGRIVLAMNQVWPVTRLMPGAVRVLFVAGYGGPHAVPPAIKLAMKMCLSFWNEHRGEDAEQRDLPQAAKALLDSEWNGEREYGL